MSFIPLKYPYSHINFIQNISQSWATLQESKVKHCYCHDILHAPISSHQMGVPLLLMLHMRPYWWSPLCSWMNHCFHQPVVMDTNVEFGSYYWLERITRRNLKSIFKFRKRHYHGFPILADSSIPKEIILNPSWKLTCEYISLTSWLYHNDILGRDQRSHYDS